MIVKQKKKLDENIKDNQNPTTQENKTENGRSGDYLEVVITNAGEEQNQLRK